MAPKRRLEEDQFRALLDLFMCSDPWPVHDQGQGDGHTTIEGLLDAEAQFYGYLDWIDAYHNFAKTVQTP